MSLDELGTGGLLLWSLVSLSGILFAGWLVCDLKEFCWFWRVPVFRSRLNRVAYCGRSNSDSDDSSNESESNDSGKTRKGGRTLVFKQAENNSPAKNTRKRAAAAAATESPMAAGKRGRGRSRG